MKSLNINDKGFTLMETILYIALLSGLTSTFIPYAYSIHEHDMSLLDRINNADER